MSMTLEEFYQAFETAHKKYPMQVLSEWSGRKIIRHQIDDTATENISDEVSLHCGYCPVTAVAKVLSDTDADSPLEVSLSANFSPNTADNWAARIGLSDEDTQYIIMAADDKTSPQDWDKDWWDGLHPSCSPKILASIKEIRGRMISILHKENTP